MCVCLGCHLNVKPLQCIALMLTALTWALWAPDSLSVTGNLLTSALTEEFKTLSPLQLSFCLENPTPESVRMRRHHCFFLFFLKNSVATATQGHLAASARRPRTLVHHRSTPAACVRVNRDATSWCTCERSARA